MPLLAAALALMGLASGDDHPELEKQLGTWQAVAFEREGVSTPEELVRTITRTVERDRVVWERDGKPFAATTLKLDTESDPKGIEVSPEGGPNRDKVTRGIYRFEGDHLLLCTGDPGKPRPRTFDAPKGSRRTLMKFRRVADPPPARKPRR